MNFFIQRLAVLLLVAGLAGLTGCNKPTEPSSADGSISPGGGKKLTIAFLPKSKGNAYFVSCAKGA
jgi:ABC-type sugar transport system substrate-binding protein